MDRETDLKEFEKKLPVKLRLVDENAGSFKWYTIDVENRPSLFTPAAVVINRGRIGQNGEVIVRQFETREEAIEYAFSKYKERLRHRYVEHEENLINVVEGCQLCRLLKKREKDSCFIEELSGTIAFLNWDQTYRGRCMLVLKTHVPNFFSLSTSEVLTIVRDVRMVEKGLNGALKPDMMNYLFMGNRAGHTHLHLVPRYRDDRNFGDSPFLDTGKAILPQLPEEDYRLLASRIRNAMSQVQRL